MGVGVMETWKYHLPVFEVDYYDPSARVSTWSGHTNFAYDLVQFMKPDKIVELGTYLGGSFFSFCQSVKDSNLPTTCVAIDTWQGDLHSGFYSEDIFLRVSMIRNMYYSNICELIRSTFDEALHLFEEESIDLLHIDGYHTYEAVKHDYTTWLPKLKKEGVVLFHDINVKERDFGVYKLWDEIKQHYPHMEFEHSYGLGVLFPKGYDKKFESIFAKVEELQTRYSGNMITTSDELPLVSILIPTYNRPRYFELALQSALNQTYLNVEIVIGDDSTDDETARLLAEKYLPIYPNIRYIKNSITLGQFDNDIMLFHEARGKYINYLMDDDLYTEKKIEKMMQYYLLDEKEEIKLVTSYRKLMDYAGRMLEDVRTTRQFYPLDAVLDGKHIAKQMLKEQCNFIGEPTTVLFRKKDLINPFGIWKERKYKCAVDVASWLTLLSQGKGVYIAEPLSFFRYHVGQQLHGSNQIVDGLEDWYHGIKLGEQEGFFTTPLDRAQAIAHFMFYARRIVDEETLSTTSFYKEVFK
jgi:glycosyltransferase involved in cell wall biosynthesis/predicted O-methyltransferase YrrM